MANEQDMAELQKLIAGLSEPEQWRIETYAKALRTFMETGGKYALIAFTLVGQERIDQGEEKGG